MATRSDQHTLDTMDELMEDAQELHDAGDTVTADLMLFSATTLAMLNVPSKLDEARKTWAADPHELEWR